MAAARVVVERVRAAATRSIESSQRLIRLSEQMCEEIDEVTPPIGVPIQDLSDEDSAVISMAEAITANGATPKRRARTDPGREKTRDDD